MLNLLLEIGGVLALHAARAEASFNAPIDVQVLLMLCHLEAILLNSGNFKPFNSDAFLIKALEYLCSFLSTHGLSLEVFEIALLGIFVGDNIHPLHECGVSKAKLHLDVGLLGIAHLVEEVIAVFEFQLLRRDLPLFFHIHDLCKQVLTLAEKIDKAATNRIAELLKELITPLLKLVSF